MDKTTRRLLVYGESYIAFVMALVSPTVQLYFFKQVDASYFAASNVVLTVVSAIVQHFLQDTNKRRKMCQYFMFIIIFDIVALFVFSFIGLESANVRFLGMSATNAIAVTIWTAIMLSTVNNALSSDKLTDFQIMKQARVLYATAAGGVLAMIIGSSLPIIAAILIECFSNIIYGACEYLAYKRMIAAENKLM